MEYEQKLVQNAVAAYKEMEQQEKQYIQDIFKARAKALSKVKTRLKDKGYRITNVKNSEKKMLSADFYINHDLCKFKMTRHSHTALLFEILNDGRRGWFMTTRAKYYIFYMEPEDKIYIIDIRAVKRYVENPLHKVEKTSKGGIGKSSSYIIPIKTCLEHDLIINIINKGNK